MKEITDEYMHERLLKIREYCFVLIKPTPRLDEAGAEKIIWEHGRRNFALKEEGLLAVVCPVQGGDQLSGMYIFNTGLEETKRLMAEDPAVKAGVFTYEAYVCRGIPGDCLSGK